jgi:hypothetical protein
MDIARKDFAIASGIIAILVFGHVASFQSRAHASQIGGLLLQQGAAQAYGEPVNERLGTAEQQARDVLMQIGSAEAGYSSERTAGRSGWLSDLIMAGYFAPNASPTSLAQGYSIAIYLPSTKQGFTAVAEPVDFTLRPIMIDESQRVSSLSASIMSDPDEGWASARYRMESSLGQWGYYQYPFSMELLAHTPPLQVRMSGGYTSYLLFSLLQTQNGSFVPDPSLLYSSYLNTYLVGESAQGK